MNTLQVVGNLSRTTLFVCPVTSIVCNSRSFNLLLAVATTLEKTCYEICSVRFFNVYLLVVKICRLDNCVTYSKLTDIRLQINLKYIHVSQRELRELLTRTKYISQLERRCHPGNWLLSLNGQKLVVKNGLNWPKPAKRNKSLKWQVQFILVAVVFEIFSRGQNFSRDTPNLPPT